MIKTKQVELALTEAAELTAPHRLEGTDGHYLFTFAPDDSVELVFDEPAQCLTLMAEVGCLDAEDEPVGHRLMLQYSFVHCATGGITLAINPVGGRVVQMFRWPVGQLSVQDLCAALKAFHHKAHLWRETIAAGFRAGSAAEAALAEDLDFQYAIRV